MTATPDLYVANGYLSGLDRTDLASFFWRQVVAKSSEDATGATRAYEHRVERHQRTGSIGLDLGTGYARM